MLRWGFWKRETAVGEGEAVATAPAPGGDPSDEWAFLRTQGDHDADEMASVRSRGGHTGTRPLTSTEPEPRLTKLPRAVQDQRPDAPRLVLEIEVDGIRMIQTLTGPALLGRRDPESGVEPEIDFNPDDSVSRRHARIYHRDGEWLIRDLGSTNGTEWNGKELVPGADVLLRDRDELILGQSRVRVRSTGAEPLTDEDLEISGMLDTLGVMELGPRASTDLQPEGEGEGVDLLDLALEYGEEAGLLEGRPTLDGDERSPRDRQGEVTREIAAGGKRGR